VKLPPGGIKDYELTKEWTFLCTVSEAEDRCCVLSICEEAVVTSEADETDFSRFRLSQGDMFRVLPKNQYRLENLSEEIDCEVTWVHFAVRKV
jgi:hypothetical protein